MRILSAVSSSIRTVAMAAAGAAQTVSRGAGVAFARGSRWGSQVLWSRTRIDFRQQVDDPMSNSIVVAVVGWIARNFPDAPVRVAKLNPDGTRDYQRMGRTGAGFMLTLLERPNPWYSGVLLWNAVVVDFVTSGDGYVYKERYPESAGALLAGRVVRLWWFPQRFVEPRGDEQTFITHYEYNPNGTIFEIDPGDIIHLRDGMDPANPRKGRSKLKAILREIYTDDEAGNFTAQLLTNLGVPGVVLAPANTNSGGVRADPNAVKQAFMDKFSGDKRGEPLVLTAPTDIKVLSWSPDQLNLKDLRRVPEERISAALGVPASVANLGAGMDHNTLCLPADARVWTTTGAKAIVDVRPGDTVWSFADGALVQRQVRAAGMNGVKPIYRLRTKNRTLRASANHPVLTRVAGDRKGRNSDRSPTYEWRRMDQLKAGDYVVQPKALPEQTGATLPDGEPATVDMLQFMGAIVGDGVVLPGVGVRMALPPADRTAAHYRAIAERTFTKQARQSGGSIELNEATERVAVVLNTAERDFGFSSARDSRRLAEYGLGGRARTKRIPGWVFGLRRDLRLAFLAGLVDTDGSIDKRGALTFAFCNRQLTEDVKDLLLSVGIISSNLQHKFVNSTALVPSPPDPPHEAWAFTASSAFAVSEIPFADPLYRERVNANLVRWRASGFDAWKAGLSADLGFYKVRAIDVQPAEPIYDLTIEDSHSFIADGVVVHNTNYPESRAAAYEEAIIPNHRLFDAELEIQLLPEFVNLDDGWDVDRDYTEVRALAAHRDATWKRLQGAATMGLITRATFKRGTNQPVAPDGSDDVFILPNNYLVLDAVDATVVAGGKQPPAAIPPPRGAVAALPAGVTLAGEVRCEGCNKLLAEQAAPPYRMTCSRCKAVTESAAEVLAA